MFGVPTIRYDIQKPARVSVADPNVIFFIKFRTMLMRLQLLNCSFLKILHLMELMIRISKCQDQKDKLRRFSQILDLTLRAIFSMLFLKDPKLFKELFLTK